MPMFANTRSPMIDARGCWQGDVAECRRLYRQFVNTFKGDFSAIRAYYGWKRKPLVTALRLGQPIKGA